MKILIQRDIKGKQRVYLHDIYSRMTSSYVNYFTDLHRNIYKLVILSTEKWSIFKYTIAL